jgi:hypothetical protein
MPRVARGRLHIAPTGFYRCEKEDVMPRPRGVDPRVDEILNNDGANWFEHPFGFGRQRQHDPSRPGYEGTDAYNAHDRDTVNWMWLDDIGLIDREGQYARTEAEKRRGLDILRARVEAIAKKLVKFSFGSRFASSTHEGSRGVRILAAPNASLLVRHCRGNTALLRQKALLAKTQNQVV